VAEKSIRLEGQTKFDVIIKDAAPKKIEVIRIISQIANLSLTDAKTLADTDGGKILTAASKEIVIKAWKRLEEV